VFVADTGCLVFCLGTFVFCAPLPPPPAIFLKQGDHSGAAQANVPEVVITQTLYSLTPASYGVGLGFP
jgi:hypothetical protein